MRSGEEANQREGEERSQEGRGKTQSQKKRKAGRPIANLERTALSITKIRHTVDACARRTEASLPELPLWLAPRTVES